MEINHNNEERKIRQLTWGVNGRGECAVFCRDCRKVFARKLKAYEAKELIEETAHECKNLATIPPA